MARNFKILVSVAAVASALAAQAFADPMEFHGYLRSGAGSSSKGGKQVCFQVDGAASKFRLGNECETYGELEFDANVYKAPTGNAYMKVVTMAAFSVAQNGDWEQSSPSWRQAYAIAGNIGDGALATANVWAGKRYYKRNDIHLDDFFYWNDSGPGGGIENIDVGFAKASYAYVRQGSTSSIDVTTTTGSTTSVGNNTNNNVSQTVHDFRLEGIKMWQDASLDLGLNFGRKNNVDNFATNNKNGTSFTAVYNQNGIMGTGWNKVIMQYADKNINLDGSSNPGANDGNAYRVYDRAFFGYGQLDGEGVVGYTKVKDGNTWVTAGVRPVYHFTEMLSLATELGYDQVKPNAGDTRKLWKLTIAPQIAAGSSYWSRPVIRAFATYAKWNDAARDSGNGVAGGTTGPFGTATDGMTYGVQMEAWW